MTTNRELTIWGGLTFRRVNGRTRQVRTVVAAPSKSAARRALALVGQDPGRSHFDNYWGETGNTAELAAVAAHWPGTVLWTADDTVGTGRAFQPWAEEPSKPEPEVPAIALVEHLLHLVDEYEADGDEYGAAVSDPDGWEAEVTVRGRVFKVTIEETS